MISNKEKEKIDEAKIKAVLDEKIFSRSYLHTIYILFVNLCKEYDYKLTPSILYDLFRQLSKMANVKYDEYKIGIFHLQIDIDKDGTVNFEDFLKFITTIIKFTYNEIYCKKGINLLPSLSLSVDRVLFIDIISNLFSSIGNYLGDNSNDNNIPKINSNLNPFTYYDVSLKFLPFYKFYCTYKNEIKMQSYYNSQKKINEFITMLMNYTNAGYISELQSLLNSQNTSDYYKGLSIFKKSIKPLNYINNELLIIMYNKNIFFFMTILIKTNILNKVLMIFNLINNKNNNEQSNSMISPEVIYTFLVIIRRILNLYVFVNETFINCDESDRKCLDHYVKDKNNDYKELTDYINTKILSPLSNNYDFFYQIFDLKSKKSPSVEAKIKYVMYQLILLTSKIKYEYYKYFINNTNYLEWLTYDIKENLNLKNKTNINKINNINNINNINDGKDYVDYLTIENVVYNCINIIDITLKFENKILNDNNNNNKLIFIKNLYLKLLLIINNMQDLIFDNNNDNYSLLIQNKILINNNNIINDDRIPLKSKYICLLGLLNSLNINENYNNIVGENPKIKEFENAKFILQIYNEEFNTKYQELTLPFCFYLRSLIINNKQILSIIAGLDIINNFYIYFTANASSNFCSFSSFLDFCEIIIDYTEPKTLINNSNIITAIISIIKKMIIANPNNNKLIGDMGIKNKLIELLSKITDLNNANINEEIIDIPSIFNIIIYYMFNNLYYIEEMSYLNKKGIVFNILLVENGLNIINNIFNTNSNSHEKILNHFTSQNLDILASLFDKISLLWDIDDKNNVDLSEEIIKNKYVFDKYKDLPKKNVLIQILLIFDNLSNYKDKYKNQKNIYDQLFDYITEIDINIRIKLHELKINSDGFENLPTLVLYTQTEREVAEGEKSKFTMEIDGLSFYTFKNEIKDGYKSDLEIFYQIECNNSIVKREIKDEKDFEVFLQEVVESYKNQPNKDNVVTAKLQIKLKEKKVKVKRKCLNCGNEMEVELDIDEKKFEELKTLKNIDSVNDINKLLDESKNLCENCEKYILEHVTNQITIENSKNKINNLSGFNLTNLNISDIPGNNTYQNIVVNDTLRNNLLNESILQNQLLSNSLFNRAITPRLGLNNISNINNQNSNLFGLNGINNISAISPRTPRRNNTIIGNNIFSNNDNTINNGLSSNMQNYRILQTKIFQ